MSAITDEQRPPSPSQQRREALRAKRAGKKPEKKGPPKRPSKPPTKIEPGWIHEAIAAVGLKALQAAAEKKGVTLNVGEIDKENLTPSVVSDGTGPQPVDIGARVVAHIAHRIPIVRTLGKRSEGRDKKAGILSDLFNLAVQLYEQNAELLNEQAGDALQGVVNGFVSRTPDGTGELPRDGVIIDFGAVAPNGSNDNNNGGI